MHLRVFPVLFNGNHMLAVLTVPVALAALGLFLRYSNYGVAIRAAADNSDRARLSPCRWPGCPRLYGSSPGCSRPWRCCCGCPYSGSRRTTACRVAASAVAHDSHGGRGRGHDQPAGHRGCRGIGLGIADQLSAWSSATAPTSTPPSWPWSSRCCCFAGNKFARADTGIGTWQAVRPVRPCPPRLSEAQRCAGWLSRVQVGDRAPSPSGCLSCSARPESQLAALVLIYGIVACSLVVFTGWAGQICSGHLALMGFGATPPLRCS